jgi:hypothetical protein
MMRSSRPVSFREGDSKKFDLTIVFIESLNSSTIFHLCELCLPFEQWKLKSKIFLIHEILTRNKVRQEGGY